MSLSGQISFQPPRSETLSHPLKNGFSSNTQNSANPANKNPVQLAEDEVIKEDKKRISLLTRR
jgi:hypothetical protein